DLRALAIGLLAARGLGPEHITPGALDALAAHSWPGNVRELENAISRALVLAGAGAISEEHLPSELTRKGAPTITMLDALLVPGFSLDELERDLLHHAIAKAGGNKAAARRPLAVTPRRLDSH